ncbi:MAG TPA: cache domain-containing protein, partial [Aggregatilineaceae bacterium]|nr:cache domain-containing protein [Aggregatilineaceae bacterium]
MRSLHLTPKLILVFVFFAAGLLLLVSSLAYVSGRGALAAATMSDLFSQSAEKESALNSWIAERQADLLSLTNSPAWLADLAALSSGSNDAPAMALAHDRVVADLQARVKSAPALLTLLVLEPDEGRVIAATDPNEEGKYREDSPDFINAKQAPYVQNVYYSLQDRRPAMSLAVPIRSESQGSDVQRLLGVLIGQLSLDELNAIIVPRAGTRQTEDAFLVNSNHLFITQPRFIEEPAVLERAVYTPAVSACLAGASGAMATDDYRGIPVFAAYRWFPERQTCLIVKIDQAEALAPSRAFGQSILVIDGIALLLASIIAVGLANSITRPLRTLHASVSRFGQGELGLRLPETSGDELGLLAREFNRMAAAIAEQEKQLRTYSAQLERKVEERTAELRASEAEMRAVFAAMPDLIFIFDAAGTCLKMAPTNPSPLFGFSTEMAGMPLQQLVPSAEADSILALLRRAFHTGESTQAEYSHTFGGREVWFTVTISPMTDDTALLVARDTTQRKWAEAKTAQALAREQRVRAEVEDARQRLAFLLESSTLLAQSLDYQGPLKQVAQLAVPQIADWCAIYVIAPGDSVELVAVAHTDTVKVATARFPDRHYPPPLTPDHGLSLALREGQAEFYSDVSEALPNIAITDPDQRRLIRAAGMVSWMSVPLLSEDQVVGAITLATAESGRHYTLIDLELATDLARRVALLIERARLYQQAQTLNEELDRRVK